MNGAIFPLPLHAFRAWKGILYILRAPLYDSYEIRADMTADSAMDVTSQNSTRVRNYVSRTILPASCCYFRHALHAETIVSTQE